MSDERKAIFTELTPPPGGLERFRRRLEQESGHSPRRWRYLVPAAVSLFFCVALSVWIHDLYISGEKSPTDPLMAQLKAEYNPAMIRLGLADLPREAVTVPVDQQSRMAVQRVAVSNPDVIYYRIDVIDVTGSEEEPDF